MSNGDRAYLLPLIQTLLLCILFETQIKTLFSHILTSSTSCILKNSFIYTQLKVYSFSFFKNISQTSSLSKIPLANKISPVDVVPNKNHFFEENPNSMVDKETLTELFPIVLEILSKTALL